MTPYEQRLAALGLDPEKRGQLRNGFISEARTLIEKQRSMVPDAPRKPPPTEELEDLSWMNPSGTKSIQKGKSEALKDPVKYERMRKTAKNNACKCRAGFRKIKH